MKIEVTPELLQWAQSRKVYVATPMYGGTCDGRHRNLCLWLSNLFRQYKIPHAFGSLFNESLITRGRNKIAHKFLQSKNTDLLLLDSDIFVEPAEIVHMLFLSKTYEGILCAPYAKKGIDWDRIGKVCSQTKEYPVESMPAYGGKVVANFLGEKLDLSEPQLVRDSGTGVMLIPRSQFELMIEKQVVQTYKFMNDETQEMGTDRCHAFFEAKIDPVSEHYLSEDWYFCRKLTEAGGKVWLCPWIKTKHVGPYEYECDIVAIAQTGENL